ncbi:hypothetical protein A9310_19880 [Gordonia sp. UCD-TK1]|nr:hypothetical protein A9310_19880 [Gordonia sp. UCD-TK1]
MSAAAVAAPPAPLWTDELTGLSVWLNGPFGGWSGRLTAGQAAALVSACEWAERWDVDMRSYL